MMNMLLFTYKPTEPVGKEKVKTVQQQETHIQMILSTALVSVFPNSPASLPPGAGGGFRGPGGDDLTVDGAQQQHEPDGSEHLGGGYPMRLRDEPVQDGRRHCKFRK